MWCELQISDYDCYRPQEANKEEFELNSMRCGRKLTKDGDVSWILAVKFVVFCWFRMECIYCCFLYSTVGDGRGSIMALTCWWPIQIVSSSLRETPSVSHVEALSVYSHDDTLRTGELLHLRLFLILLVRLDYMWLWTTKPVIRVNFLKLRFINHPKAE